MVQHNETYIFQKKICSCQLMHITKYNMFWGWNATPMFSSYWKQSESDLYSNIRTRQDTYPLSAK
uniref:Uncharacterized protein n=1 Tax=Arundo donax TaxID=35708 RepID=A0A0A8YFN5_ARUDO